MSRGGVDQKLNGGPVTTENLYRPVNVCSNVNTVSENFFFKNLTITISLLVSYINQYNESAGACVACYRIYYMVSHVKLKLPPSLVCRNLLVSERWPST